MSTKIQIADQVIVDRIILIRGVRVMLDSDLAELYGVTTKRLNEQVKRNRRRFPEDFMFRLSKTEKSWVVANCDHLQKLVFSSTLPYVFTEFGAVMLASVLNSERAITVNIQIVRIFTRLRELALSHKDILFKLEQLEKKMAGHDKDIQMIFQALKQLIDTPQKPRRQIGFKSGEKAED